MARSSVRHDFTDTTKKRARSKSVGRFLARSHWGGIYNREMKQLMLRHAFQFVNSVIFLVGPQNLRSQRAMEKIGGFRAGSRRDGGGRESFVYQITPSTFLDTFAEQ